MYQLVKGIEVGLMDGPAPYSVNKGIRNNAEKKASHLAKIGSILKRDPFELEANFDDLSKVLVAQDYGIERFAEIFHDVYLNELSETLERKIRDDPDLVDAINDKVKSNVIAIRCVTADSGYNWIAFVDGRMEIHFRSGKGYCIYVI